VPVGSGVVGVNSTESFYVKEETKKKKKESFYLNRP
jgi:hypothetical protein